jgi:hypothetical protein
MAHNVGGTGNASIVDAQGTFVASLAARSLASGLSSCRLQGGQATDRQGGQSQRSFNDIDGCGAGAG